MGGGGDRPLGPDTGLEKSIHTSGMESFHQNKESSYYSLEMLNFHPSVCRCLK